MSLKRFSRALYVTAAGAVAALCACSLIVDTDKVQCASTADCIKRGSDFAGLVCGPQGTCVSQGGCTTNAECIDSNGGKPFICNKPTRTCVNLQVDLAADAGGTPAPCTPYASPEDIRNDETIWLGAIIDTKGPQGGSAGPTYVNMMELARREISKKTSGLPPASVGGKSRPLAFVHCESNGDTGQAVAAASYLADQAGFQLFVAGDSPTTGTPVVTQVLLPKKALNLSLQAPGVADVPSGSPPLFFRMNLDLTYASNTYNLLVTKQAEAQVRARFNLAPSDQIRVASVYNANQFFQYNAQWFKDHATFNGKSAVDNAAANNFKQISYSETATPAEFEDTIKKIVDFNPHVIVGTGFSEFGDSIFGQADAALLKAGSKGPQWVYGLIGLSAAAFGAGSINPELQSRVLWPGPDFAPTTTKDKLIDYATEFPQAAVLDPTFTGYYMVPYDVFYLYAYAVAANGANPINGENIAKAISKVFTPNATQFLTGTQDLFAAFTALGAGGPGSIFLKGRQAFRHDDGLDLNLETGSHPYWPFKVYCPVSNALVNLPNIPPQAWVSGMPAGLNYTAPKYEALEGTFNPLCEMYANGVPDGGTGDGG